MRVIIWMGVFLVPALTARAADTFSLAVSARDTLIVFGPHGEKAAELSPATIAKPVTAGGESFVLSFGHNVDGYLQAIVEPPAENPGSLHFCVLGRHVRSAPSAVITLTFSENIHRVTIDPGVDGVVEVDARPLSSSLSFAENWNASTPVPGAGSTQPHPPPAAKTERAQKLTAAPEKPKTPAVAVTGPSPKKKKKPEALATEGKQAGTESSSAASAPSTPEIASGPTTTGASPSAIKSTESGSAPNAASAPAAKTQEPAASSGAIPAPPTPAVAAASPESTSAPVAETSQVPENSGPIMAPPASATAGAAPGSSSAPATGLPDVTAGLPLPSTNPMGPPTPDEELPAPGAIAQPGLAMPDNSNDINFAPMAPQEENPLPPLPRLELNVEKQYSSVLPQLNPSEKNPLYQPSLLVKRFEFVGNTVYSSETLATLLTKYTGHQISMAELEAAGQTITLYYVDHGYINSGAILPDQNLKDGVIKLQIVEGKLTDVAVSGNIWFQTWWLRNQIRLAAGNPLNFNDLKLGIQNLREVPTIDQVNAELQPGGAPGESTLDMKVKDTIPFHISTEINNYRPPSVGSTIIQSNFTDLNLTGNNDPLSLTYGVATLNENTFYFDQLENWSADYIFPISPWDTTMEVSADRNNTGIEEAPFNELTIKSRLEEYHVAIHQAIISTPTQSLVLSLQADERRNVSALFGIPYSLSPGAVNGVEQVFVPRFIQEFVERTQQIVFSARSQFSLGLDDFNSTVNPGPPNGKFFAWLGQAQYIQRLGQSDNTLIAKTSGQISDRPLLTLEQSQLGGISSIRGYLENQILRDNSYLASLEFHLPLVVDTEHNSLIALAPFTDFGVGWNNVNVTGPDPFKTRQSGPQTVAMPSVGVGLLVSPIKYVDGQIYWGYGLNRRQVPGGPSLQNEGVEFSLSLNAL